MSARWAPVRIEPMPCSGELVTIAVAIQGEDDVKVVSALPEDVATAVFGSQGGNLLGIARSTTDSLYRHLRGGADLSSWKSPLSGVYIGDIEYGEGCDLKEIAEQALRASACLSAMTEAFRSKPAKPERNSLLTKMYRVMKTLDKDLADHFSAEVPVLIRNTELRIRCDYFSSRLAINMGSMAPGRTLNQQFDAFNARLCRLDQLKANEALAVDGQEARIILATPSDEQLDMMARHSNVSTFRDRLLMAQDLAEKRDLKLMTVLTPELGARFIKSVERRAA